MEEIQLPTPESPFGAGPLDWRASVSREEYYGALKAIKDWIHRGDTYQVNYTHRLRAMFAAGPWDFFLHLMAAQEAPYGAFIEAGDWVIASASPELFFRLEGERIECRPMKGTAARGLTLAGDLAQAEALAASEKERAENVMIVDMVRHDLGRVAQTGSVTAARLFEVEKYPTLWQMTSTIEAKTQADLGELFRALFPPASVTGAPKARTMQIIARLESAPRRVYTGAIGFLAPGRQAQFNVAIRTLLLDRRSGQAEYGVGGGITWDSQPEAEWQECRTKTRILAPRVPAFSLLETMLWTPQAGCFLLDLHLERLENSALYFGFALDLTAVRRELEGLASRLSGAPRRIRLLVAKSGGITLETKALPLRAAAKPPRLALAPGPVEVSNPFLYHKTTHRGMYEAALAACPDADDALLYNERGEITESTMANVVVEIEGKLCTPPVCCGLLAGVFREHLLRQRNLAERPITVKQLLLSPRVFLINSVRGMYQVEVSTPPARLPYRLQP